jgi:hypothetical protein
VSRQQTLDHFLHFTGESFRRSIVTFLRASMIR